MNKIIIISLLICLNIAVSKSQNVGVTDAGALTPQSVLHVHKNAATGQTLLLTNTTSGSDATTKGFVIDFDASFNAAFKNMFNGTNAGTAGFSFWTYTNGGSLTEKINIQNDGTLRLLGSTSGYVGLKAAAVAGSTTFILPSADGTNGQVLSTNGSGVLTWVTKTSGSGDAWTTLGNAGTDPATNFIGTTDAKDLVIKTNNTSRAKITSAGVTTVGDGTNQTKVETDGTVIFEGNATCFTDLVVPVNATNLGGSKDPVFAVVKNNGSGSQGVFAWWFDSGIEEELYFSVQLPHEWKEGTDIYPHIHWTAATDVGADKVKWGMEYVWSNIGSSFGNTTLITGFTPIAPVGSVTAFEHAITALGTISGAGKTLSSVLICRVYRDATAGADDSFTGDAALLQIDFHFQVDMVGSRSEYTK